MLGTHGVSGFSFLSWETWLPTFPLQHRAGQGWGMISVYSNKLMEETPKLLTRKGLRRYSNGLQSVWGFQALSWSPVACPGVCKVRFTCPPPQGPPDPVLARAGRPGP